MLIKSIGCALFLVTACTYKYPVSSKEDLAVLEYAQTQYTTLNRNIDKCNTAEVQVYQPKDPAIFLEMCRGYARGSCNPNYRCLDGCFVERPTMIAPTKGPTIVVAGVLDPLNTRLIVAHEAMHWLQGCATGDTDFYHADPEVWADAGVLSKVEKLVIDREEEKNKLLSCGETVCAEVK